MEALSFSDRQIARLLLAYLPKVTQFETYISYLTKLGCHKIQPGLVWVNVIVPALSFFINISYVYFCCA